jgi:hypothetical protein
MRLPIEFTTVVTIDLKGNLKYIKSYLAETRFITVVTVKYTDCRHGPNAFLMEEIMGEEVDLDSRPCL